MPASLSVGNFIILLGCVQGIFLSALLFSLKDDNRISHRMLATFLVVFVISMLWFVIWDSKWILTVPHLSMIEAPFEILIGPLFYLYILSLTRKDFHLRKIHALHLIIPLLVVIYFFPFYLTSAEYKIQFNEESYRELPEIWKNFSRATSFYNIIFILLTVLHVERYRRTIRRYYSNVEKINLKWFVNIFIFSAFAFVSCVLLTVSGWHFSNYFSNIAFSVGIYILGYIGIRQKAAFTEIREPVETTIPEPAVIKPEEPLSRKYEKSGLSEEKAKLASAELDATMQKEKLYLDPELNLQQLADKLNLTIHHLSQILNQYKQQNFFDYVNQLRVEEFKRQLNDPGKSHLSILGLAFECGFNSKAAFNSAFKKYTGTTPSAFKRGMSPEVA